MPQTFRRLILNYQNLSEEISQRSLLRKENSGLTTSDLTKQPF